MNRQSFWDDNPDPYSNNPLPPQQQPVQNGLLNHNTVILQQVRNFMKDNFDILDANGRVIGYVEAEGSTLGRMLMGSRSLLVRDFDGTELFRIKDPVNFGFDTFEVYDATSSHMLAKVKTRLSFLRARLDLSISGFRLCDVEGSFWGFSYSILADGHPIANIDRQWSGFNREMLGHQRYALNMNPGLPPAAHASIIGTAIALDLMRKKRNDGGSGFISDSVSGSF